jgi:hypothetical protein
MTRRSLLKLAPALALLLANWRVTRGETMALKGVGVNNLNASLINPLNVGWFKTTWGDFCKVPLPDLNPATRWCVHLYDLIPNPSDIAAMVANNPNYDHWVFVGGNEPDLDGTTPKQTKQLATAQMDMVLQGDPDAKFCLTMGSQVHAFGGEDVVPYVSKVWEKLDPFYRNKILAFHVHYYPQMVYGNESPAIYTTTHLQAFCDRQNEGLMALDGWKKQQKVWLTEIGLVQTPLTNSDPRTLTYPANVLNALGDKCGRLAWYGFESIPQYHNLHEGGLTPLGQAFGNV